MLFTGDVRTDVGNLCGYIDQFFLSLGIDDVQINIEGVFGAVHGMISDCPYPLGAEPASPFKKAASFTTNFIVTRPVLTTIPAFGQLSNHQNELIAFSMSIDLLHAATIKCSTRGDIVLGNKISVSEHFLKDTMNAFSSVTPSSHFDLVALVYESLAYQFNNDASYERVF